ncbi:P-loop NTPase fold protein, partial [Morganella morganii]
MNSNLKNYLDYYTKLENPGYALLITGGWGSGKTYQINKYFERKKDDIC